MQICTSPQTDNHASTPPLTFLQADACRSTNSVKAMKANASEDKMKTTLITCINMDMIFLLQSANTKQPLILEHYNTSV